VRDMQVAQFWRPIRCIPAKLMIRFFNNGISALGGGLRPVLAEVMHQTGLGLRIPLIRKASVGGFKLR